MKIGPNRNAATSASSGNSRSTANRKPSSFITLHAFHGGKEEELARLLQSRPLDPSNLKQFVDVYNQQFEAHFPGGFPNTQQRFALFQEVSNHYLKLYTEKLRAFTGNPKSTLADLVPIMNNFIQDFPEGEKSLIHCQNNPVFIEFSKHLHCALKMKAELNASGRFHKTQAAEKKPSLCVEALLLQSLAKLPIATSKATSNSNKHPKASSHTRAGSDLNEYGNIIKEFIVRATNYLNDKYPKSAATVTMTAGAISYFDIDAFSVMVSDNHSLLPEFTEQNLVVGDFIQACLASIKKSTTPAALVRIMHSICLLSPGSDRKKYLTNNLAQLYFANIADTLSLESNVIDRALASQLFILKNIYSDVFPEALSDRIAPHITTFQQQAHGSAFEKVINRDITAVANELARSYPGLIDPEYFDFENPINAELGMESDVAYTSDDLNVCIQIDGDKYHRHLGSNSETQRTKLRDFCFLTQNWQLAKFSDSAHGKSHAKTQLLETIVIPTFEIKTQKNIDAIKQAVSELETLTLEEPLNARRMDLIRQLSQFDSKGAKSLTTISSQLKIAEVKLSELTLKKPQLQGKFATLDEKVKSKRDEIQDIEMNIDTLQTERHRLNSKCHAAFDAKRKAQTALAQYDPANRTELVNRMSLKAAVENADNFASAQEIELAAADAKLSLAKSTLAKLKISYDQLRESQSALSGEIATNDNAIAATEVNIEKMHQALRSPIMGTDLLDAYASFKIELAKPKKPTLNLKASSATFIPPAMLAKANNTPVFTPQQYPSPEYGAYGTQPYGAMPYVPNPYEAMPYQYGATPYQYGATPYQYGAMPYPYGAMQKNFVACPPKRVPETAIYANELENRGNSHNKLTQQPVIFSDYRSIPAPHLRKGTELQCETTNTAQQRFRQ